MVTSVCIPSQVSGEGGDLVYRPPRPPRLTSPSSAPTSSGVVGLARLARPKRPNRFAWAVEFGAEGRAGRAGAFPKATLKPRAPTPSRKLPPDLYWARASHREDYPQRKE